MSAPNWLVDHLIAKGVIDEQGVGRRARVRHCASCGMCVLAGFDADIAARSVACDPHPLTALGEAVAQLQGRYTCALHRGGRPELDTRSAGRIRKSPAGTGRADVLAEHRCENGAADSSLLPFTTASVFTPTAAIDLTPGLPAPF